MTSSKPSNAFFVGCSRSGTSVIQTYLAAHSQIQAFPETGYFDLRKTRRILNKLGLFVRRSDKYYSELDDILETSNVKDRLDLNTLSFQKNAQSFFDLLTSLTQENQKSLWLEKTPKHFYLAKELLETDSNIQIFFIIRNGEDVVASIADRAEKFPQYFAYQRGPRYGIRLYNDSLEMAQKVFSHPRCHIISFERFIESPEEILAKAYEILGLRPEESPTKDSRSDGTVKDYEGWKSDVSKTLTRPERKFEKIFSKDEQELIKNEIDNVLYKKLLKESL